MDFTAIIIAIISLLATGIVIKIIVSINLFYGIILLLQNI